MIISLLFIVIGITIASLESPEDATLASLASLNGTFPNGTFPNGTFADGALPDRSVATHGRSLLEAAAVGARRYLAETHDQHLLGGLCVLGASMCAGLRWALMQVEGPFFFSHTQRITLKREHTRLDTHNCKHTIPIL